MEHHFKIAINKNYHKLNVDLPKVRDKQMYELQKERERLMYELFETLRREAESGKYVKDYDTDGNYVLWKEGK